ncbi:MAG: hypothetical protein LBG84_08000 [Treponema sp.]|nr:hypothetical protein [Treponema sp.]
MITAKVQVLAAGGMPQAAALVWNTAFQVFAMCRISSRVSGSQSPRSAIVSSNVYSE